MTNRVYLSNAFSLQMVDSNAICKKIDLRDAKELLRPEKTDTGWGIGKDMMANADRHQSWYLPAESVIGHADIAGIINSQLGLTGEDNIYSGLVYPVNRVSIKLRKNDVLVVGQYVGPRLQEGATELPADAKIEWYQVEIQDAQDSGKNAEVADVFFRAAIAHFIDGDTSAIKEAVELCFPGMIEGE